MPGVQTHAEHEQGHAEVSERPEGGVCEIEDDRALRRRDQEELGEEDADDDFSDDRGLGESRGGQPGKACGEGYYREPGQPGKGVVHDQRLLSLA
ncbi:hypothetical protein Aau02nite_23130 [Amorphoplanes auranticolor]|uniref:Uncharacterized protein n=1 Tax=Actinoplanes auranticolor TaxID=47988 RepID=A0A919S9X7_9ACTN|nr:hypothetical protein Aau02nite_23130 [Actinoplanes auranticolor]